MTITHSLKKKRKNQIFAVLEFEPAISLPSIRFITTCLSNICLEIYVRFCYILARLDHKPLHNQLTTSQVFLCLSIIYLEIYVRFHDKLARLAHKIHTMVLNGNWLFEEFDILCYHLMHLKNMMNFY